MPAKRKKKLKSSGTCYLCGAPATTRDHVPPKGVFPAPRPHNLLTLPACGACNLGSTLHDEYFRVVVATGSRDSERSIALLNQRIIPRMQKSPALIAEIMKSMRWIPVRSPAGLYVGRAPAFNIDVDRVQYVLEKIVRGLFFKHTGKRLPPGHIVTPYIYNPPINDQLIKVLSQVPLLNIGDGSVFSYRYMLGEEDPPNSYWFLMFYNDTTLFITQTLPADEFAQFLSENGDPQGRGQRLLDQQGH